MAFVRNNVGIIIFSVVWLVVAVVLAWTLKTKAGQAHQAKKELDRIVHYFEGSSYKNDEYRSKSKQMARKNKNILQQETEKVLELLRSEYSITVEEREPLTAKRYLERQVQNLRGELSRAGVEIARGVRGFTFKETLNSGRPPPEEEVRGILRNLRVIQEVARLVKEADVDQLVQLNRPRNDATLEKRLYYTLPLDVTVKGDFESVRNLTNAFQTDADYLFTLRNLRLESEDQTQNLKLPERDSDSDGRGAASAPGFSSSGRVEPSSVTQDGDSERGALTRRERMVFEAPVITAEMEMNLVTFKRREASEKTDQD